MMRYSGMSSCCPSSLSQLEYLGIGVWELKSPVFSGLSWGSVVLLDSFQNSVEFTIFKISKLICEGECPRTCTSLMTLLCQKP